MTPCDAEFCENVAEQLRIIGDDLNAQGLAWQLIRRPDREELEFSHADSGEFAFRITALFNDERLGRQGWRNWLHVRIENGDEAEDVLTLAWFEETSAGPSLPPGRRGLNADADIREGRYARGDALKGLAKELRARATGTPYQQKPARLTLPVSAAARGSGIRRGEAPDVPVVLDADFEEIPLLVREQTEPPASPAPRRMPPVEELNERIAAEILEAMQQELAKKDARFAGTGLHSSAKAHTVEAIEWGMLGIAYAVEAKTNQAAMSSFMPGAGTSWLYGLVGPVLIGGLASLTTSNAGKAAAFVLMAGWALAMAVVTASDRHYLDGAQVWFPKGAAVLAHEKALARTRLDAAGDQREVNRLEARPASNAAALIADATKRWQARELKSEAAEERGRNATALVSAKAALAEANGRVSEAEFALREALLADGSRKWAWRSLFLIFGVINFAGPFAISRVLEKWRRDHASAKEEAQKDHVLREEARLLRQARAAQTARAMKLLEAALARLEREGIAAGLLNSLDGAALAAKAAERFDRTVNPEKFRKRFRLWGAL